MPKKTERTKVEELVRKRKRASAEQVAQPAPSTVRTCVYLRFDGDVLRDEAFAFFRAPDVGIGSYVVIWEYAVDFQFQDDFHEFLRQSEQKIVDGLASINPDARYRGTYLRHSGGTPNYRTVWSYSSLDDMINTWAKAIAGAGGPLKDLAMQLRGYWLRDPQRQEARYLPAAAVTIDARDGPFARMTNDQARAMMLGGAAQPAASRTKPR